MTRPEDKPNTRYFHYDYDDASPGVCKIACEVIILPDTQDMRDQLQGKVHWSIDTISGSTLSWQNGGSASGVGGYISSSWFERAVFTGLPSDNVQFGEKNLTVTLDSMGCSQPGKTKVFFRRDEKNHPGSGSGTTPNWFYYWPQGAVGGGLSDFEYGGASTTLRGKYAPSTDKLYIYSAAPNAKGNYSVTHKTNSTLQFTIGINAEGIDAVAGTVIHEKKHQLIYHSWSTLPDNDNDGVPDSEEEKSPYYFDKNDPDSYSLASVIDPVYSSIGDQEFLCRMEEKTYVSDSTKDWASPGKQWTYGRTDY
jgi:hypothetical protein